MCAENNSLHCSTSAQSLCFRGISVEVVEKTMHNVNVVKGFAHKACEIELVAGICKFILCLLSRSSLGHSHACIPWKCAVSFSNPRLQTSSSPKPLTSGDGWYGAVSSYKRPAIVADVRAGLGPQCGLCTVKYTST